MPSRTGSLSYCRFRVAGDHPSRPQPEMLEALAANVLRSTEIGAPPEMETGWSAGRHVFDTAFDAETNVFGDQLAFGLRVDTHRVPAEIRRAYRSMATQDGGAGGAGARNGLPSRADKRHAAEQAEERCRVELAEGRFRTSKMIPVLWDLPRRLLLAPAMSEAAQSALRDLFHASFDGSLEALSAGALAGLHCESQGASRDYEDLTPSRFSPAPPAGDTEAGITETPTVPWCAGGPEPKDFLGNEFLLWLWWHCATGAASFETTLGTVELALDRSLAADCAWGVTGNMTLSGSGPHRAPESLQALRCGKWPRKAGILLACLDQHWRFTLQADRFILSSIRLPKPDDPPASDRQAMEYRIGMVLDLDAVVLAMYERFLDKRIDRSWATTRERISQWIRTGRASEPQPPAPIVEVKRGATVVTSG